MEGIGWGGICERNEIMRRVGEKREFPKTIRHRKMDWLGNVMRGESVLRMSIKEKVTKGNKEERKKR